ncbi:hypothetical protein L1049_003967 [Liquidambar formosana]|uniref:Uncharacterized protein n=1 Tax=Liquidambar formosana TaxID=63359 RepID=A0AAP0RRS6_LIQFO
MQEENERGLIVQVQGEMRVLRPDEGQQHKEEEEERREQGPRDNGLEETFCTMKFRQNINTEKEAEVYSRRAGRINVVNQHKLPILRSMDMSAERGNLFPVINLAMFSKTVF